MSFFFQAAVSLTARYDVMIGDKRAVFFLDAAASFITKCVVRNRDEL